jgi:hypothetical protein
MTRFGWSCAIECQSESLAWNLFSKRPNDVCPQTSPVYRQPRWIDPCRPFGVQHGGCKHDLLASIEEMPYKVIVLYSNLARYYVLQGLLVLAVLRGRCYTAPADRPIHGGRVAFTVFSTIPHLFASVEQAIGGALVVLLNRLPLSPFAAQA